MMETIGTWTFAVSSVIEVAIRRFDAMLYITNRMIVIFHKSVIECTTLVFSFPICIFAIDVNKTTSGTHYVMPRS